jgi:hypothetical protein
MTSPANRRLVLPPPSPNVRPLRIVIPPTPRPMPLPTPGPMPVWENYRPIEPPTPLPVPQPLPRPVPPPQQVRYHTMTKFENNSYVYYD